MKVSQFFPKPHPTKEIFHRHGIPVAAVAKFLGLCTTYTGQLLNGAHPLSIEIDQKLHEFARLVESEAKGER